MCDTLSLGLGPALAQPDRQGIVLNRDGCQLVNRGWLVAMIAARILHPGSKLATARALKNETCASSLNLELQLGAIEDRELYEALDWLQDRQAKIESRLARRHLQKRRWMESMSSARRSAATLSTLTMSCAPTRTSVR